MNPRLLFAALLISSFLSAGMAPAAIETWRSVSGNSIEAEYAGFEDGVVVLKSAAGEVFRIDLSALDETSQKRVQALGGADVKKAAATASKLDKLTKVFPDSYVPKNEKVLVTHRFEKYDAVVCTPSCSVNIFVKEKGKYLTDPIKLQLNVWYYDKAATKWPPRPVVELTEAPTQTANSVHFKCRHKDDVYSESYFEFSKDGIIAGYLVKDPETIKIPSNHRLQFNIPSTFREDTTVDGEGKRYFSPRFPDGMTYPEIRQAVTPYVLTLKPAAGKSEAYAYSKPVDKFVHPVRTATIGAGPYGSHILTLSAPRKDALLQGYIYPGNEPRSGYMLMFVRDDPTTAPKEPGRMVEFRIE
jgi:hypothetical protein